MGHYFPIIPPQTSAMENEKRPPRRKQSLPAVQAKPEKSIEDETGIPDTDFFDLAKLKKLAYLTVIQEYLRAELEKDAREIRQLIKAQPPKSRKKKALRKYGPYPGRWKHSNKRIRDQWNDDLRDARFKG